ncbi:MAG: hypothetical protein R3B70_35680 [Polyangiaceae bacterium]
MSGKPGAPGAPENEALPPTALAELRDKAKERLGPEPDKAGPAAMRTMAAVVRDLKGMPEILVQREHTHKIKLQRRGKVGGVTIEFHAKIAAMEVGFLYQGDIDPTATKLHRYTFAADRGPSGEWRRLDDGGELIDDVRRTLLKLYPELGDV